MKYWILNVSKNFKPLIRYIEKNTKRTEIMFERDNKKIYEINSELDLERINKFVWENYIVDASSFFTANKYYKPELYVNKLMVPALREFVKKYGKIEVTSTYRPLGSHVEGVLDNIDPKDCLGHWIGMAVDINTLVENKKFLYIEKYGFSKPFNSERWHYRFDEGGSLTC